MTMEGMLKQAGLRHNIALALGVVHFEADDLGLNFGNLGQQNTLH